MRILSGLILVIGLIMISSCNSQPQALRYKGVNLTSWQRGELAKPEAVLSLTQLAQTEADTVLIVPTWYMDNARANEVRDDPRKSTSADELRFILQIASDKKLKTALKPHVDLLNGDWRGNIDPQDPDKWFASYSQYMIQMAKIAEEKQCVFLVMGTELKTISGRYREKWFALVQEIRRYYRGPLVYASNWDEYNQVCFWEKLDILGVDAYFPLSNKARPTLEELTAAWSENGTHHWLTELEAWHNKWQKPVMFTEVGYMSWDYAARSPWDYSGKGHTYDGELQADCYRALIVATKDKDWINGIFFWNWEPKPVADAKGKMGLPPQGKPAEQVLKEW